MNNTDWGLALSSIWEIAKGPLLTIAVFLICLALRHVISLAGTMSKEQRNSSWYRTVYTLVSSAQQQFKNQPGDVKYEYVKSKIHELIPQLSDSEIKDLIEAAVFTLNNFPVPDPLNPAPPPTPVIEIAPPLG